MKKRTALGIGIGLQWLALIVIWAVGSGSSSKQTVVVPLSANTVNSILEADRLHLPLAWSRLSSFDVRVEGSALRKGARAYLWLEKQGERWVPTALSASRPKGPNPVLLGTVTNFEPIQRFTVTYERQGQTLIGTYVGPYNGKAEPGTAVWVSCQGGRIVFLTPMPKFENKVYGTVVSVRKSAASRYAYDVDVRFPLGGKEEVGRYSWNFYDLRELPQPGQPVNLSYVAEGQGYRITYVDFAPSWPGKIDQVEKGWSVQLNFGLEDVVLGPAAVESLRRTAATEGELPIFLRSEVKRSGHLKPIGLLAGETEVLLSR
jgi:hypothetical protein